ncbi:hypothetical protein QTH90_11910 [Variovorax sp. J2P1-59]|uniref:hypothetical protein n=1 Tax=Variovorax flavidus TaxID=3053501 RepID=UPI0025784081|nr:hypothetical protein [Variovorax sp. J2P1-59]MDM0075092.1 hypothetical protein [Variovorax sp. J2P1-59]
MTLADVKDVATILGVVVGAGSLLFAALNLLITARTNRAKFWLELRSAFARHDEVHRALRPGGKWAGGAVPSTPEEYFQIEAYMGLFEHCEIMISQRLIDEKTFREIYRYRLVNLLANRWVREVKVCGFPSGWKRFIELLERFQVEYACPKPGDA